MTNRALETRVEKLEERQSRADIPPRRMIIRFVGPCPDQWGPCQHVRAAKVGGKVFQKRPGESIDALTDRATADETGPLIFVEYEYETTHGAVAESRGN